MYKNILISIILLTHFCIKRKQKRKLEQKADKGIITICSHDYIPVDCFLTWYNEYLINGRKSYAVVRENYSSINFPGIKFLRASTENLTKKMIDLLKNKENIIIFYQRKLVDNTNLHKIAKECDFYIQPITIKCNTLNTVDENDSSTKKWIPRILTNKFLYNKKEKILCDNTFTKDKFIRLINKELYDIE